MDQNDAYDSWFFTSREPDGWPTGTHLLMKVCDNDPEKFRIALDILQTAFEAGRPPITDELVERAAKAVEKLERQSQSGWTDEEFEIWWNKDPYFVERETSWGDAFGRGTRKERLLWIARKTLEAAFNAEGK